MYLVHRLRTNLIFKQIPLYIPRMGFVFHMFVNDALPQMVDAEQNKRPERVFLGINVPFG